MAAAHFDKGDKVEVTRGDDSSQWFPASVLRPFPAKHKGQIYVEFETLTSGESKNKRLREYVYAASVRPQPPAELHRCFKVGDNVDAFHDSGWRVGTIADILENSRYSVSFDGVVDEKFEFDQWNLRLHRDWDDGSWIPPIDPQMKPRELKLKIKFSGRTSEASFSKGTMLEVRGDRDGCPASWYSAAIVNSISTDKFLVEYQTLRTGDKTKLLKEIVDASYIRPCPPEIPQIDCFKQFQEVDAWINNGWWVGHIFEVLDNHKYVVYLINMKSKRTVEHSQLRPHQVWIDGKWFAASTRTSGLGLKPGGRESKFKIKDGGRTSKAKLSKGTMVEVKSDEEGYQGSWFTATILGSIGKDKFLVQYQTLKTEDETDLLKENADATYVRPCPPVIQRLDRFKLFEKVDAWYNDGWWVGLISKVLDGLNYAVYFWTTNEELVFGHFSLRPHQEWSGGKWVADFLNKPSALPRKPIPGKLKRQDDYMSSEATNCFSKGMKVEVKSDDEEYSGLWYPAVIMGSKGTGKYLVEYRTLKADNEIKLLNKEADAPCMRPCPPIIQRRDPFEPFEEIDAWYNDAWWVGTVCKVCQGSKYAVFIRGTKEVLEFQHSDLRPHQDWIGEKWVIPCRGRRL